MTNTIAPHRWILIITITLLLSIAVLMGILTPKVNVLIPLAVALVIPLSVFVVKDLTNFASYQKPSKVLPLLMVSLPFYNLFLVWRGDLIWQCISLAVFIVYFRLQSEEDRRFTLERAKPLMGPMALLLVVSTFPVIFAEQISRDVLLNWFIFASAITYWLLACLYCRSFSDIYRLLVFLIMGALIQFPIFMGQVFGWTSNFPGGLAKLSPDIWGGSLVSAGRGIRYPGSFADVELVAEYLGIIFLLGLGLFLVLPKNRWKLALIVGLILVVGMGALTGTRGFLVMIVFGSTILLYGYFKHSRKILGSFFNVFALIFVLILSVIQFLPDVIKISLSEKFASDQLFNSGNLLNRGMMFSSWLDLLPDMPFWGFGSNMLNVINSVSPFPVISPHSLYFSTLFVYGYLGLGAIIILIATALIMLMKSRFRSQTQLLAWVFFAVIISWAFNEIKIEFLRLPFYVDFIFLLFGLSASSYSLSLKKSSATGL